MRILTLDLETYSGVDLKRCGVYAYTGLPTLKFSFWLMPLRMNR